MQSAAFGIGEVVTLVVGGQIDNPGVAQDSRPAENWSGGGDRCHAPCDGLSTATRGRAIRGGCHAAASLNHRVDCWLRQLPEVLVQMLNVSMGVGHFGMFKHLSVFASIEHPDDEFVMLA
jgi:hypothetical protein